MSSITCHFVLSLVKIRPFREADGIDQYSRKAWSSEAIKHLLTERLSMRKRGKKKVLLDRKEDGLIYLYHTVYPSSTVPSVATTMNQLVYRQKKNVQLLKNHKCEKLFIFFVIYDIIYISLVFDCTALYAHYIKFNLMYLPK